MIVFDWLRSLSGRSNRVVALTLQTGELIGFRRVRKCVLRAGFLRIEHEEGMNWYAASEVRSVREYDGRLEIDEPCGIWAGEGG